MAKPPEPDAEETRSGFRSGEGADSVMRHLMAAASRRQRRKAPIPDSRLPSQLPPEDDGGIDIPLPPA